MELGNCEVEREKLIQELAEARSGVADSGYESTFLGSYKTHHTWFIAIGKS
jgi:hypothetical protein